MTPHASFLAAGLGVFVATHVARAEPPAATPFARLAARPCASTEGGRAAAEASDWDAAVSAYRVELPDDVGLPAAGRADRVLLQALDVARGAACTVEKTGVPAPLLAQVKGETAAARSAAETGRTHAGLASSAPTMTLSEKVRAPSAKGPAITAR